MEKALSDAKAALCKTALLAHPQQGLEAGIDGGCLFTLCWSSFAAEVFSNLSMATPGIFLQEMGASPGLVFSFRSGAVGLLC
jgi:hypothetical protein